MFDTVVYGRRAAALLALWLLTSVASAEEFERCVIDGEFAQGYQVSVGDVDSDGDPDVLALSTNPAQLVWYRNPEWTKFTVSTTTQGNIDLAPHDIDGDGDPDLALASEFDLGDSTKGGLVQWLECPADPTADQEWTIHAIDAAPTSHRVRWADVTGDGSTELVNLPIIGVGSAAPEYAVGVQLKAYSIPSPLTGAWTSEVIDTTLTVAHGLAVASMDDALRDDLLTASAEGIHVFRWMGRTWSKERVGVGHEGPAPQRGSSEVALGRSSAGGARFLAAIEPWHGNEVAVYLPTTNPGPWRRERIDDSLDDGHALVCIDVDSAGAMEIVAGQRGGSHDLCMYRNVPLTSTWNKSVIDAGGMAAAGMVAVDVDADARTDIVAIGTATHNVVWYRNITPR